MPQLARTKMKRVMMISNKSKSFSHMFFYLFNLRQATTARSMPATMKRVMKLLSSSKRRSPPAIVVEKLGKTFCEHDMGQHRKETKIWYSQPQKTPRNLPSLVKSLLYHLPGFHNLNQTSPLKIVSEKVPVSRMFILVRPCNLILLTKRRTRSVSSIMWGISIEWWK